MHNSIRVRLETSIQLADYFFSRAHSLPPLPQPPFLLFFFLPPATFLHTHRYIFMSYTRSLRPARICIHSEGREETRKGAQVG